MTPSIKDLPWRAIRKAGFQARRLVATTEVPEVEHLNVNIPAERLVKMFRIENFRSGWFLSYHYKGEDANLSRAEYANKGISERQLHVRLFDDGEGGTLVYAHVEACPVEHPRKHLNEEGMSVLHGVDKVKHILDKNGTQYEVLNKGKG